jgi:CRISPR system Cascade subunit CasE
MYLSRLILNPRSRRVQRELAEPYEMHRSLMKAFPPDLAPREERMLFRVDEHPRLGLTLLVQSCDVPNWSWLAEEGARGYLLPVAEPNPAVKPFDLHPVAGQTLGFRLRANPTIKTKREGRPVRNGLFDEDAQQAWLVRKAEAGGFRILSINSVAEGKISGGVKRVETTHKLTLLGVRFDGLLQVTDPDRLVEAVRHGIGSAKGLGFGLLSLAPAPG